MSLTYGPRTFDIKPTSAAQVTVLSLPAKTTAVLSQSVSVGADGSITFTVSEAGSYQIIVKEGQSSVAATAYLTNQEAYDVTDFRSYVDKSPESDGILASTGRDDTDNLQAAVNAGNVMLRGTYNISRTITVPSNRTIWSTTAANISWRGADISTPIFDMGASTYVTISGLVFAGKSNLQRGCLVGGGSYINILNNRFLGCSILASGPTTGLNAAYASVTPEMRAHHIKVVGNTAFGTDKTIGTTGINFTYTDHWQASGNTIDTYRHGISWWGGDANNNTGDGALANERKCTNGVIFGNQVNNINLGGIWGSMGQNLTIGPDNVNTCGDVGVDLEGCFESTVYVGVVKDCTNGNLATFFGCRNVSFIGGQSILTTTSTGRHLRLNSNPGASPYNNYGVSLTNVTFNTLSGDVGIASVVGPGKSLSIRGCTFMDTLLAVADNNQMVSIENNQFNYTRANSVAFNACTLPTVIGPSGTDLSWKRIISNIIHSDVAQPSGSRGISSADSDFNNNARVFVQDNNVSSFFTPDAIVVNWSGTNAGKRGYFLFRNNICNVIKGTSTGAAQAATIVESGNYNRALAAVTVTTV